MERPIFQLTIVRCDYERGWTWHLQVGRKDFVGWTPNQSDVKWQSSPEEAYADYMRWAIHVGVNKMQEVIAEEKDVLHSTALQLP